MFLKDVNLELLKECFVVLIFAYNLLFLKEALLVVTGTLNGLYIYVYKPKKCLLTFQKCRWLGLPSQWTVSENLGVFPVFHMLNPSNGCGMLEKAHGCRLWEVLMACLSRNDH